MSSPGYFYGPEDQDALTQLKRRQAYAQALLQQGSGDAGNTPYAGLANAGKSILGAFLANRTDKSETDLAHSAQDRYTKDIAAFLKGDAPAAPVPSQPSPSQSPQLSNVPGQPNVSTAMPPAPAVGQPPSVGAPPQGAGAPVPQPQQPAQAAPQSPMDRLLATHNPALIQLFAPQLFTHQLDVNDRKVIPLTDQEAIAAGLRPGGVYGREAATGNLTTIQPSDMKSQGAFQQGIKEHQAEQVLPPEALAQKIQLEKLQQGPQWAALNKPVSVGYGDTLVNPRTGKVVYGGNSISSPLGPDGKPLTGDAFLKTLSPGIAGTANAIATYRQAPLTPMALRSPQGAQLMAAVNQINPGYDASQYGTKVKARNDFATGKNGNTVRSLNVAVQHLDQLGQLSAALNNGDIQGVNKISQFIAQQTGSAAPTNFGAAKQLVADEVVKAIVGAGGGVSDRETAAANISRASSPQQLAGVIQTYKGLMAGQLSGLKQQYEHNTGLKDFEDNLAPETKAQLQNHQTTGQPAPASRFKIEQVH